ncbi:RNA-binding transcriptional accessory protein [Streptococcus gallolyticus subsp. gallolyticus]|uniref:Tex family protein n=1 Tax=Streptococcus gallolyticus TaxID=315405 RepID=UPI00200181D8|nr:Tex family protein [Streptococcus gallolyticus]MCF0239982.1 RNA-binding transcriptional accessory protein [Streptococcus gallolyticus]MCY7156337.1 RNA-binding transcriptional accessory protein [Streptococcus gallolyticus subsp. gallolyticus]MCY7173516.1 RNA-binding transcriptional accessory protein [Streptococcus gallolyticus subsp. gallolyticus]MCY7175638.1 RNA-binding transcriptional accessory protein [Streptococcus gallolyticus subsp. gallolyticus]MCY7180092.1 RNA-binding transcriptional
MENENVTKIAQDLNIKESQIAKVLDLTSQGNTIPFIARYRKEMTGNLDEVQIKAIIDLDKSMTALADRKATVLAKIEEQGKLTAELKKAIENAEKLADVEELYLPYKEKRRTKATIAREAGLFPLARLILQNKPSLEVEAANFITEGFETADKALAGACEILIEAFSEDNQLRSWVYNEIWSYSSIISTVKDEAADDNKTFQIYYDFSEKVSKIQGYRILALNRGEKLGILKVGFEHNIDKMVRFMGARFKNKNAYIDDVIAGTIKKKIVPAMERRVHSELTESAEDGAIELFSENLRNLLLVSPLKGKMVLGFDPAFRTGAKLAVVDQTGKLMTTQVIYPVPPASQAKIDQSKKDLAELIRTYGVEIIAIGNGTASRESEAFVAQVLKDFPDVSYVIVNESGASVYSASELARHEFPDLTVEKRSAISIARRLQDPLAELVKIDPKSIGVGQYQHDVSQKKLAENLDFVVDTVVNQVGVNINTASPALLAHVSGLNKTISENIVKYRDENGRIASREEIKKVPRLGAKAFEQAAGFLRIPGAENILDNTGVHPESYKAVERLLKELNITDLDDSAKTKLQSVSIETMAETINIGQETLKDIIADLLKPGRDLRDDFEAPVLRQDVLDISDLEIGQKLEGTVRNVVDFGAFVDIGLHDDGLIHISQMSTSFVKHPSQVVSVGDVVTVWVSKIDKERGKINLSLVDLRELN